MNEVQQSSSSYTLKEKRADQVEISHFISAPWAPQGVPRSFSKVIRELKTGCYDLKDWWQGLLAVLHMQSPFPL